MPEEKQKIKNPDYIENRIERVLIASTATSLLAGLILLVVWIGFTITGSNLTEFVKNMTWLGWLITIACFVFFWVFAFVDMGKEFHDETTITESHEYKTRGNLYLSLSHDLDQEEVLKRIKGLLGKVKTKFANEISNVHEEWDGTVGTFKLTARGYNLEGSLKILPNSVEMDGNLPFPASLYAGKIKEVVRQEAQKQLI